MTTSTCRTALTSVAVALFLGASLGITLPHQDEPPTTRGAEQPVSDASIGVYYLEIVTPDVDATCEALATMHRVTFSQPDPSLGNARTAPLRGGWRMGVRAPMHGGDGPVVRPYRLVENIDAAVEIAQAAGAEFAILPTDTKHGRFAIYLQGGIEHGLWQSSTAPHNPYLHRIREIEAAVAAGHLSREEGARLIDETRRAMEKAGNDQ